MDNSDIRSLSDEALLIRIAALAASERAATAALIECMAVVDERRLWEGLGYSSMFTFCAYGLRLGEAPAFKRIRAARAIRLFPPILTLLRERRLTLEAVAMLHPHLESPDVAVLVTKACGLRIKALEALLSDLRPAEPARDLIRFTGSRAPAAAPPAAETESGGPAALPFSAAHAPKSNAEAPDIDATPPSAPAPARLVRIAFTADEALYRLLEKARASLRHKYPDGQIAGVIREALVLLIERRDPVLRWRTRREKRAAKSP